MLYFVINICVTQCGLTVNFNFASSLNVYITCVYYTLTHLSLCHLTRKCVYTHLTCVGVCYCVRAHSPCIGALSRCLQTAVYNAPVCVFVHSTCQCVYRHPVYILKLNPSNCGLSLIQLTIHWIIQIHNEPVWTLMGWKTDVIVQPHPGCVRGDWVHSRLCNHPHAPKPAVHINLNKNSLLKKLNKKLIFFKVCRKPILLIELHFYLNSVSIFLFNFRSHMNIALCRDPSTCHLDG